MVADVCDRIIVFDTSLPESLVVINPQNALEVVIACGVYVLRAFMSFNMDGVYHIFDLWLHFMDVCTLYNLVNILTVHPDSACFTDYVRD